MRETDESLRETIEAESGWPIDPEPPVADVADQRREVVEEPSNGFTAEFPREANPADVADQRRVARDPDEEFR